MALIPRRHLERRLDRLIYKAHRVIALETRADVVEDPARLLDARLVYMHGAEAARERLVFLDVFLVLAQRGRADHAHLAAREHRLEHVGGIRRRAERGARADHRVRLVDEQNQVRPLLDLADHVLDAVLEHAAQHRARDHRVHLQVHDLAVAQPHRHRLGLELDPPRQPFDDGGLADAGLANQHHRVRALAMAEDFQDLLNLLVAAEHRRHLVLAREEVQVRGKVFQERRQLEALLQTLFPQLQVAHPGIQPRHQHLRFNAMAAENRDGHSLRFFEDGRKQIGGFNRLPAGTAGMMQRQLEDELRRRRDAQLASRKRRHHVKVLFDGLQNRMRIQLDVPHDFRKHVPFNLCERQKDVFVGQERMFTAPGFLDGAVDDALGGFAYLARGDVQVVYVHRLASVLVIRAARRTPAQKCGLAATSEWCGLSA